MCNYHPGPHYLPSVPFQAADKGAGTLAATAFPALCSAGYGWDGNGLPAAKIFAVQP